MLPLAVAVSATALAQEPPGKRDLDTLQGTWLLRSVEQYGETTDLGDSKLFTLTANGDKLIATLAGEKAAVGTLRLDASRRPKTLDVNFTVWIKGHPSPGMLTGIYKIEGDSWLISSVVSDAKLPQPKRPAEFKTRPRGEHAYLWLLRRDRPAPPKGNLTPRSKPANGPRRSMWQPP
jgi:uncharacterized protein (TIGR03067 family)